MSEAVYQVMTALSTLVTPLPMGPNLGLLHLLWTLVSGRLLASRGALFPALQETGLSDEQVRRAWAALTSPGWSSDALIQRWVQQVAQAGRWQAHRHGGYQPVAVDLTGFWRPRLRGCPTTHDHAEAGKALPAIPLGLITRIGSLAGQRVGLLLGLVRADPADPSPRTHAARLVAAAVERSAPGRRAGR